MISIREEIKEIEAGKASRTDNLLKHAPHAPDVVGGSDHSAHGTVFVSSVLKRMMDSGIASVPARPAVQLPCCPHRH
jgi:hypothetical protein